MGKATISVLIVIFLLVITPMLLIVIGILPNPFEGTEVAPEDQYGFDLQIEGYLIDKFDETPTTSNLEGLEIDVYLVDGEDGSNRRFKETVTSTASAGGRFRTSQTYSSGDYVLFMVNGKTNYNNASVIVQLPFYSSEYPPSYHYLSKIDDPELDRGCIALKAEPTLLPRVYKATGAEMTLGTDISTADWDISSDGSSTTFRIQVYSSTEETGLSSWYDYENGFLRQPVFVLKIPRYRTGTTAAVGQTGVTITSCSHNIIEAKAPTSGQDGVYVIALSDDCVDVDKNQATGQYYTYNTVEITITFDFSACGASANFTMYWELWEDTDYNTWASTGLDVSGDAAMYTRTSYLLAIAA